MSEKLFDVVANHELMTGILELARQQGIETSSPMSVDSTSDALDSPLGVDELRQALEVVTMIASTGTTVIGFLAAVKVLVKRAEPEGSHLPQARLIDTRTRKHIATIAADTDLDHIDFDP